MNRRKFLSSAGISIALLTGCTGILSSSDSSSRNIGDTATYEGVEVTPTEYLLTEEVSVEFSGATISETADEGAVFVLTHLEVTHNGDSAQPLPYYGAGRKTVDNYYDGEFTSAGVNGTSAKNFIVDGIELPKYEGSQTDEYPGTEASGWIITQVASNFDPSELELRVTWNEQLIGDRGETTHTWAYTTGAEASVGDVEDNSTTVTMG